MQEENNEDIVDQEVTVVKEETKTETESLILTMTIRPDPLRQLLQCLNRSATTAQIVSVSEDRLHVSYSTIMSKVRFAVKEKFNMHKYFFQSCIIAEDDDDGGGDDVKSFQVNITKQTLDSL